MKLIKASYEILAGADDALGLIELAGRTCYKSEEKITTDSNKKFVEMILKRGHESVIEHKSLTVKFICDRGVSHELVRHRLASFSQESTRYCNYSKDKFDNQLTFIIPPWFNIAEGEYNSLFNSVNTSLAAWNNHMIWSEATYKLFINKGQSPEQARSILPNSLKTEIVVTANLREWREILRQRTAKVAHPQMRELMRPLLDELKTKIPVVFDSIEYES